MAKTKNYQPLPAEVLLKRGYCCGNLCSECPYFPAGVKGNTKVDPEIVSKGL